MVGTAARRWPCGPAFRAACLAMWFVVGCPAHAAVAVPVLKARVTDLTGTLTADQTAGLEAKLAAFEAKKGSQVALLMVPTTAPETIEQYAIRVASEWRLGRKGVDDGVLFLVALEDRKVRIEVGYGLEGVLPDATANRIIDETVIPSFRRGDIYGGVALGIDRIIRVVEGEALPAPEPRSPATNIPGLFELLPVLLVVTLVGGAILRRLFGRAGGALATGGLVGAMVWLLVGVLAVALIAGVLAFVFSLGGSGPGGPGGGWYSPRHRGGWGGYGGGFGGGGGFSGGGGGFGGGGASGSW